MVGIGPTDGATYSPTALTFKHKKIRKSQPNREPLKLELNQHMRYF
mgnify:CR=1 FL=1